MWSGLRTLLMKTVQRRAEAVGGHVRRAFPIQVMQLPDGNGRHCSMKLVDYLLLTLLSFFETDI
jgi:hypothetical protein